MQSSERDSSKSRVRRQVKCSTAPRGTRSVAGRRFSKLQRIAKNSLAAGISTVLMLLAIEVGARLLFGAEPFLPGFMEEHRTIFYAPKPSAKGFLYIKDGPNTLSTIECNISSQGLRNREVGPKQEKELRILMSGDSFTMGFGLTSTQTISSQLERMLRTHVPINEIVTVVNGGVVGYSPWQERVFMNERGLPLQPDIVVLQLFPQNDVDGSLEQNGEFLRSYNTAWKKHLRERKLLNSWPSRVEFWMRQHSGAYRVILKSNGNTFFFSEFLRYFDPNSSLPSFPQSLNRPFNVEANLRREYPELNRGWNLYERSILEMKEECEKRGVEFVAYAIPARHEITQEGWDLLISHVKDPSQYERGKPIRRTEEICLSNDIAYIDVANAIKSRDNPNELYFKFDAHLNVDGARFVAERITEYLVNNLPPRLRQTLEAER